MRDRPYARRGRPRRPTRCGVEWEDRWKALAEGNLALAWEQGASGRGTVVQGDARQLSRLLVTGARDFLSPATEPKLARLPYGAVDLVLLSPPYACDLIEVYKTTRPAGHLKEARNYSGNRRNLGHAHGTAYLDAMAEVWRGGRSPQTGRLPRHRHQEHAR